MIAEEADAVFDLYSRHRCVVKACLRSDTMRPVVVSAIFLLRAAPHYNALPPFTNPAHAIR